MQAEFQAVKEEMAKGKARANKLHSRLELLTAGYAKRMDALAAGLAQLSAKAQTVCPVWSLAVLWEILWWHLYGQPHLSPCAPVIARCDVAAPILRPAISAKS